jgi:hypothetical protein
MSTAEVINVPRQNTLMRPIASPKELMAYHTDMVAIIRESLIEGVDYGTIPGTKKSCLFKAGAEKINIAFGTHGEYFLVEKEVDHNVRILYKNKYGEQTSHGLYRYVYKCVIKKLDGTVIGECDGSASTLETKYISRPRDMENTIVKMAQKRAYVGAVLNAFGLSDRFTQDLEDIEPAVVHKPSFQNIPPPDIESQQATLGKQEVLMFNTSNDLQLDKLLKKLEDEKIPSNLHDDIAQALNGLPFTVKNVEETISKIRG